MKKNFHLKQKNFFMSVPKSFRPGCGVHDAILKEKYCGINMLRAVYAPSV